MSKIQIRDARVMGPGHPAFGLQQAWYMFGMFAPGGSVRRMLMVKAHNEHAVHMIESLVQRDGSVSDTCALMSMSAEEPLTRSAAVEQMAFWDFIIEMVDADRWMPSPFLLSLFQKSLSEVQKAYVSRKMDEVIKRREFAEQEEREAACQAPAVQAPEAPNADAAMLEQLQSGLANLGFQKRDVQKFVESVRGRQEPLQVLLMEGIKQLNRGLS